MRQEEADLGLQCNTSVYRRWSFMDLSEVDFHFHLSPATPQHRSGGLLRVVGGLSMCFCLQLSAQTVSSDQISSAFFLELVGAYELLLQHLRFMSISNEELPGDELMMTASC